MKINALIFFFLLSLCALTALDVSGDQFGFWTLENSPYNLIGDVTIPAGVSLHIEPGVTVSAMGNYRITALGQFYAAGSPEDSIRFVSGQADPNALWKGIRLESTTLGSTVGFCYIEKAEYGINSINSPVLIHHSRFYKNQKGMQLYGIGAADPAQAIVSTNIIEWSIQNGILIAQNSNAVILGNELRFNGTGTQYMAAIQLSNQSTGGSNSPTIESNYIHHNFKQGITAWDIVGANAIQPLITDNIIEFNLTGIYLLNASGYVADNFIRNNYITGDTNSGAGVMVAGATSAPYFERNEIYGNFTGFYIGNNANPCLGNNDIDHIWAQGENRIFANIDGSNIPHSIYTYSYTNSSIVIKAENNYWGTNDPFDISVSINDHSDDPALPTIDFTPYIIDPVHTSVICSASYAGTQSISNYKVQFIGVDAGEILAEFPIEPNQNSSFDVYFIQNFHVVILAYVAGSEDILYGSAGGFLEPTMYSPGDFTPVFVGNIVVLDQMPPRYQDIGTPITYGAHTLYPVYNRFFIYHWSHINWLYQQGDYLYLKIHSRYTDAENITFNLPDGTVWDKAINIANNDTWTRTEIIDDSGTQRISTFTVKSLTGTEVGYGNLLYQREAVTDSLISVSVYNLPPWGSPGFRRLYQYNGSYLDRCESIVPSVEGDYLTEGISWSFTQTETSYAPSILTYDAHEYYYHGFFNILTLFWQAPADDGVHNWTHYRIYNSNQLFTTVPFFQREWHTETLPPEDHFFTIRATDGTDESQSSAELLVWYPVSVDDPAAVPASLFVHPNPVSLSGQGTAEILIHSGKALSGKISIYNLRGQLVQSIPLLSTGDFSHTWDLCDAQRRLCGSGIYFIRAEIKGEKTLQRRLVLIK